MDIAACGDDGVLYPNYCAVLRSQCEKNRYIQIIDYDTCPEKTNTMRKRLLFRPRVPRAKVDFRTSE
jgi:hypothetical protein